MLYVCNTNAVALMRAHVFMSVLLHFIHVGYIYICHYAFLRIPMPHTRTSFRPFQVVYMYRHAVRLAQSSQAATVSRKCHGSWPRLAMWTTPIRIFSSTHVAGSAAAKKMWRIFARIENERGASRFRSPMRGMCANRGPAPMLAMSVVHRAATGSTLLCSAVTLSGVKNNVGPQWGH